MAFSATSPPYSLKSRLAVPAQEQGKQGVSWGCHGEMSSSHTNNCSVPVDHAQAGSSGPKNFGSVVSRPAPLLHGWRLPSVGLLPPVLLQRNCCGGSWSPDLPPFFMAGSSPSWGSSHSISCHMAGMVATPGKTGPSGGDSSSCGPSAGNSSSSGPSGGDGSSSSSGSSRDELGRGVPGHGGGSGSFTSPSYPVTGGSTGDAEQQAAPGDAGSGSSTSPSFPVAGGSPGDAEQQAAPGDAEQQAAPGDAEQQAALGDAEQQAALGGAKQASLGGAKQASLGGAKQASLGGA
ncbi:UNVERIFIED_CONTAM: hypothetical protein FKN15_043627 [Acipenser sinensis]